MVVEDFSMMCMLYYTEGSLEGDQENDGSYDLFLSNLTLWLLVVGSCGGLASDTVPRG